MTLDFFSDADELRAAIDAALNKHYSIAGHVAVNEAIDALLRAATVAIGDAIDHTFGRAFREGRSTGYHEGWAARDAQAQRELKQKDAQIQAATAAWNAANDELQQATHASAPNPFRPSDDPAETTPDDLEAMLRQMYPNCDPPKH